MNRPADAEAASQAIPYEELESVQRGAEIPRFAEHLAGQGDGLACRGYRQTWPVTDL